MKTILKKIKIPAAFWLFTCCAWLALPAASSAQVVLGSWLSASIPPTPANDEGWQRGQGGFGPNGSIFASSNSPSAFDEYAGVVAGYSQSLVIHEDGYGNVRLFISLTADQIAAFTNNSQLNFTFSCPASATYGTTAGYMQMVQFQCNSSGAGFQSPGINTAGGFSETGDTNNNSNGQPIFYFDSTSPARSQVVSWDYSSLKATLPGSSYVQLVFIFQVGGGAPTNIFLNNITLDTPHITYTVDDFSTNGVQSTNPTNYDWAVTSQSYVDSDIPPVWGNWFGGGFTSLTFAPNVDADNNTNTSGSMAVTLTWAGSDQFVIFQGFSQPTFVPAPGDTASIGFPQYTNLECDVRFDDSSAGVTNANGVLGVIRTGVRPVSGGQSWLGDSYTTISDTKWHHINASLSSGNGQVAAGNIAGVLIGEDVGGYVPGGLVGSQILYIDNIKFTGPLKAIVIPPPTIAGPVPAKPALRIFAGSTANTFDRQQVYTVDTSKSWADPSVTYPVTYSYSLMNYTPNIQQVHLELTPGGTVGQYTDYGGPNLFWMVLSPGPTSGQVVCNIQWKTNSPNGNPNITALRFTNSTAVGTWSLVFTSPSAGYVVAPGNVILGPTNFTITDPNVATDFGNPLQAVFGLQPNSPAGQGQYLDYGMIKITGFADVNEFEDFTTEGSDIVANLTPSGFFNNSASYQASSTVIVTTNDTWWVNWTQPANGFTLATTTNLNNPNWINPGWYNGYTDTNAPRVMPLTQPFGSKFWVLLPKDSVPTANGLPNPTPPAAGPSAPTVFFHASTNTVSP